MSPSLQNNPRRDTPSKSCTTSGCGGMMTLRRNPDAQGGAPGDSGPTWVCDSNPSHVEVASAGE